ncbi:hypothetical protein DV532_29640 (plasmid) [Pseudomonas sp. Leaf58]|nr:hypothetical protein DV532_29640 [Pseudomonas sp. Leaf58]KQN62052.1 hypothetical protein ASF02_07675 [Pseudomonas sp. Leaf58]
MMSKFTYRVPEPTINGLAGGWRRLGDDEVDPWFETFWGAIERELCTYQPPVDAQRAFSWAYTRSTLVNEVTAAFNRFPMQAFKPERLSRLLLATASVELKNSLFAAHIRMRGIAQYPSIDVYEFKEGQDWDYHPFEKVGESDVFSYLLAVKANPFMENGYLTDDVLTNMGLDQLAKLIDLLDEKLISTGTNGTQDANNLEAILRAMQLQYPNCDVLGYAGAYWRSVGLMFGHSERSHLHNTWDTLQAVIIETQSQLLFDRTCAHMVANPGMAVTVDDVLDIGFSIAAYDDPKAPSSEDNPRFSIARSIGKKILANETQKAILEWTGDPLRRGTKASPEVAKFLYQSIAPLLARYDEKLKAKSCHFNPKSVSTKSVLDDISEGQWLRMRLRLEYSSSYRDVFDSIPLHQVFEAVREESLDIVELVAPHIEQAGEADLRKLFTKLLTIDQANRKLGNDHTVRLALFGQAYAHRLSTKPCGFLFDDVNEVDQVARGIKLLENLGAKPAVTDILERKQNEQLATHLLEIDMGL